MGVLDWFRMQNNYGGNNAVGGGGYDDSGEEAPQQSPPQRQAPTPVTRPGATDNDAMQSIIMGGNRPTYQTPPFVPDYGGYAHPELDKYAGMLDEYPDRPRPSIMRQIGVGALSFANAQQPDQVQDVIGPNGKITRTIKHGNWQPYGLEQTKKYLDMPYDQDLADYRNKLAARREAAGLERQSISDRSLSAQRASTAYKNVAGVGQKQEQIDINSDKARVSAFSAETRRRAEEVHNMTDTDKIKALQEGRIQIEDMHNAAALDRVNAQQTGATKRTEMQQTGATTREREQQTGATTREREHETAATTREREAQTAAGERQTNKQDTGQLPTQQKVARQLKANKAIQEHPEWQKYISTDSSGMVQITPPAGNGPLSYFSSGPDQDTYNAISSYLNGPNAAAPEAEPGTTTAPKPKPKAAKPKAAATIGGDKIEMYAPDGKSHRMVPSNMVQTAVEQGYTYVR